MKGLFILLFVCLLVSVSAVPRLPFSIVGADDQEFGIIKQNFPAKLIIQCDNCTYINITSITYPNKTIAQSNIETTKIGTEYNATFTKTNLVGDYVIRYQGDLNDQTTTGGGILLVTPNGDVVDTGASIMYLVILVFLVVFFGLMMYWGVTLPWKNETDLEGDYMVKVEWKKYLKLFCLSFGYVLMMSILYIMWNLSGAYLSLQSIHQMFLVLYSIMRAMFIPLFVLTIILGGIKFFKDLNLGEQLKKGYDVKAG